MPSETAQAEINRQIEQAVQELEAAHVRGGVNIFLAQMAGGVADLVNRADLIIRVEAVISGLTMRDLLGGAITNIARSEFDASRPIKLPSREEFDRQHPFCDDKFVIDQMKAHGDPHLRLCLEGDIVRAVQAATTPLFLEEIACTMAVMGQFESAIAFIDARTLEEFRKTQMRCIILLEKCRRELPGFTEAICQARPERYERLHLILALAGRLPWIGYPYPDY